MKANDNLCEQCIRTKCSPVPSFDLADTGVCGCCGDIAEVFDLELTCFYLEIGLLPEVIHRSLPRLRNSYMAQNKKIFSWPDIGKELRGVITVNSEK